jgi:hypothetical protein
LFKCQRGEWPIKYLGTIVCARRPIVAEMGFPGEKKKEENVWMGGEINVHWWEIDQN